MTCALNEDSDQPRHLHSLVRNLGFSATHWEHSEDCADAHADLIFWWVLSCSGKFNLCRIVMSCLMTKPTKWRAPSEDSDQPGHLPSLIRVFAVRMKKAWVLSYPLSAQWRHWSVWEDAQADLSLGWAHMPFCWFCHEVAQLLWLGLEKVVEAATMAEWSKPLTPSCLVPHCCEKLTVLLAQCWMACPRELWLLHDCFCLRMN